MNVELQNEDSGTLNWSTLKLKMNRVFFLLMGWYQQHKRLQRINQRTNLKQEQESKEKENEGKREAIAVSKLMTEQRTFIHLSWEDNVFFEFLQV
jgi:PDZ domain-containing secreted protein